MSDVGPSFYTVFSSFCPDVICIPRVWGRLSNRGYIQCSCFEFLISIYVYRIFPSANLGAFDSRLSNLCGNI